MVDKIDTAAIIIALVIIIIAMLWLLLCYRWQLYPYTSYVRVPPDEDYVSIVAQPSAEPFTQPEIEARIDNAAIFCDTMANTNNFMTQYCGVKSEFGLIDCSQIPATSQ